MGFKLPVVGRSVLRPGRADAADRAEIGPSFCLPKLVFVIWLVSGLNTVVACRADVSLPPLFTDHAVLQKAERVPVWGRAAPHEKVVVTVGAARAETIAGGDGQWRVALDLRRVGAGPFELVVQGNNRLAISDVVVGEVWICGGQSNMALEVSKATGAAQEIPASANRWLRQYDNGKWIVAGPSTTGEFKAVGYYFGKELQKRLNVPVGLPIALQPATAIELWISPEGMDQDPDLKAGKQRVMEMSRVFNSYGPRYLQWQAKFQRQDRQTGKIDAFASPQADTTDWKQVDLPALFAKSGLPDSGAVWVRRQVTIPPALAGKDLLLELGAIRDFSAVYWNGVKVGESRAARRPIRISASFALRRSSRAARRWLFAFSVPRETPASLRGQPRFGRAGFHLPGRGGPKVNSACRRFPMGRKRPFRRGRRSPFLPACSSTTRFGRRFPMPLPARSGIRANRTPSEHGNIASLSR